MVDVRQWQLAETSEPQLGVLQEHLLQQMVVEPQPGSLVVMEGEHQLGQTDHALSILTMEIVLLMAVATVHQLGPPEQKHQLTVFKMDFRLAPRLLHTNRRHLTPTTGGRTLLQATAGIVDSMRQLQVLTSLLPRPELIQLLHLDHTTHQHQLPTVLLHLQLGELQLQLWMPQRQATTQHLHQAHMAYLRLQLQIGRMMALAM